MTKRKDISDPLKILKRKCIWLVPTTDLAQGRLYVHRHGVKMIYDHWNQSQAPPKKPLHPSYTHYDKARHEFLTLSPNKRSIRDKTERNRINRVRLTTPKVHLSKTIHDWLRPLRIVPYRAIFYAFSSKRAPNDGYLVPFCKQYLERLYVCLVLQFCQG